MYTSLGWLVGQLSLDKDKISQDSLKLGYFKLGWSELDQVKIGKEKCKLVQVGQVWII